MSGDQQNWVPMESNPDLMSKFLWSIGVGNEWSVVDVIGLDEELLQFIGGPVAALVLLYPLNEDNNATADTADDKIVAAKDVFYMRQTIHNACGTIALIHSVANNGHRIKLNADSPIKAFIDSSQNLSPEERGRLLESNAEICSAHQTTAREGETAVPADNNVNHHFVALVHRNGTLYELDGRKSGPISHGTTSDESFLSDAAGVCRKFIAKDPNNLAFTVVALSQQNAN